MVISLSEEEERLGIRFCNDDNGEGFRDNDPISSYYVSEEPDYERMYRMSDRDFEWFRKHCVVKD